MSYLASTHQPLPGQYYFALNQTPANPAQTTVSTLLANGNGNGVNNLGVVTVETKDPGWGGSGAFVINNKDDHLPRWEIGVLGVEDPENSPTTGSDFAIFRYDNSGNGLAPEPLTISRTTGVVTAVGLVSSNLSAIIDEVGTVGAVPASTPATGLFATTFTVTKPGAYLVETGFAINVDGSTSATVGASDFVNVALMDVTTLPPSRVVSTTLKPFSMPNTASSGLDYGLTATTVALLQPGHVYQFSFWVNNVSGTLSIPADSTMSGEVYSLC